jgi:hypothetical protein
MTHGSTDVWIVGSSCRDTCLTGLSGHKCVYRVINVPASPIRFRIGLGPAREKSSQRCWSEPRRETDGVDGDSCRYGEHRRSSGVDHHSSLFTWMEKIHSSIMPDLHISLQYGGLAHRAPYLILIFGLAYPLVILA